MKYAFYHGLYDSDGDSYDRSLLVFVGDNTIIKFKDTFELELFANQILKSLPEIRQNHE
jgi:hypothetical protein